MRMNMNGSYSDTISIINDKEHLFSNYMRFKIQLLKLHFHSHDPKNDDLPSSGLWINLRSSNLLVLSARDDDARRRATTQIALWGIGRRWPVRWINLPGKSTRRRPVSWMFNASFKVCQKDYVRATSHIEAHMRNIWEDLHKHVLVSVRDSDWGAKNDFLFQFFLSF